MGSAGDRPHALVFPLPHQGHWNPLKIFIRQMASMNISITVMASPVRIAELQELKNEGEFDRLQHVELVAAFPDLPKARMLMIAPGLDSMKEHYWAQQAVREKIAAQKSAGHGPTFLVADMFLYWTQDVADDLGIPRYTYFTSPTPFALLIHNAPAVIANDYNPRHSHRRNEVVNLPGLEIFRVGDVCAGVFDFQEAYRLHSKYLAKASGILINSWQSYDSAAVDSLRNCLEKVASDAKAASIHLIGPLMPAIDKTKKLTADGDESGCIRFLDTQPAGSVLYICFGSQVEANQRAITELARGLELVDVPFLWILARGNSPASWDGSDVLPDGFLSRTRERGFVCTAWAPQTDILAHPSVGGFVSHCGWNSLVEAVRAGVAVIPWPWIAEQHMNARFLSDVVKIGIQIQPADDGSYVGEEIAKAMASLMHSDEGKKAKLKMIEMKKTVDTAFEEGGCSQKALQAFLEEVSRLTNSGIAVVT